jgi:hypothetical protein
MNMGLENHPVNYLTKGGVRLIKIISGIEMAYRHRRDVALRWRIEGAAHWAVQIPIRGGSRPRIIQSIRRGLDQAAQSNPIRHG